MEQRFPMEQGVLRCRQVGDRAELTMEVPGPGQGLYRGYACLLYTSDAADE